MASDPSELSLEERMTRLQTGVSVYQLLPGTRATDRIGPIDHHVAMILGRCLKYIREFYLWYVKCK